MSSFDSGGAGPNGIPPGMNPYDQFGSSVVRLAMHLRAYLPLYAMGLAVVLIVALFPSVHGRGSGEASGKLSTGGVESSGGAAGAGGGATEAGATGAAAAGGAAGGGAAGVSAAGGGSAAGGRAGGAASAPIAKVAIGQGTTRGGFDCKPGVNQIPFSEYAPPCVGAYSGGNGGPTSRGVTADQVLIVRRQTPDSPNKQAVQQFAQAAGQASADVNDQVRQVFIDYFNKTFETYGRKVVFKDFKSNADSTSEAEGQGKDKACADADAIANQLKAFAETGEEFGSAPFSECAADQKLMELAGGPYYDETWYRRLDPYVWNGVMECERISHQLAEYIGKRLLNKPAKWAGEADLQVKPRRFGTYVPNNDAYQRCTAATEKDLHDNYGAQKPDRFNYVLDVSRFPDQASQAIVQFHAAGDTTIVLACDPISPVFLTQEAKGQRYYPEWLNIGVAADDTDVVARLWDQDEVTGHLFGMSQLGAIQGIEGKASEPGIVYKRASGKDIPEGTTGNYFWLMRVFTFIQAAGPILTPQNAAAAVHQLPPGGAPVPGGSIPYAVGYTSFRDAPNGTAGGGDHTQIDDSREIYWDADGTSPYDNNKGTYVATYGGKRFRNNEWPAEDPPVYPANDPK